VGPTFATCPGPPNQNLAAAAVRFAELDDAVELAGERADGLRVVDGEDAETPGIGNPAGVNVGELENGVQLEILKQRRHRNQVVANRGDLVDDEFSHAPLMV
jgi:hypothetical protein